MECTFVWIGELGGSQPVHPIIEFSHKVALPNSVASTPHTTAWNLTSPPLPTHQLLQPPPSEQQRQINGSSAIIPSSGEANVNRKSSLFRGWTLKRNSSNATPIPSSASFISTLSRDEHHPSPKAKSDHDKKSENNSQKVKHQ